LAVGEIDADHLRGGVVGQPRRQGATAAGHVQDAPGGGSPDRRQVALVGALVGGGHIGGVLARFEHGQVEVLTPVGVVEVG
jgi:hypothetical protein